MSEDRLFLRVARVAGYSFLGKAGAKLLGVGHYVLLFFLVLKADLYGQYSFILAYVGIFAGLAEGGVAGILVREMARAESAADKGRTLASALLLLGLQGVLFWLLAVAVLFAVPTFRELPELPWVLFFSATILLAPYSACEGIFRALLDMRVPVWANLLRYGVFLLGLLPGGPFNSLPRVVMGWWGCMVVSMAVVAWLGFGRVSPVWGGVWGGCMGLFRESAPLFLTRLSTVLYYRIDQVMLRLFFPEQSEHLAWYVSAVKLTEAFNMLPAVLMEGIYPALAGLWKESRRAFEEAARRVWRLFVALAGIVALGIVWGAPLLLRFKVLEELRPAWGPLVLLGCAEAAVFLNLFLFQVLIAAGFQRPLVGVTGAMVFGNVAMNALFFTVLLPGVGHVGAAAATLLTECLGVVLQISLMRCHLPQILIPRALLPLGLLAALALLLAAIRWNQGSVEWVAPTLILAGWGGVSLGLLHGEHPNLRDLTRRTPAE